MYGNNFFNPYMYQPYYQASNFMNGLSGMNSASGFGRAASGLAGANSWAGASSGATGIKGLLGKFSFSGFLNGASKTLNVVNQAIPIFYQVKPIFNNAKTMFRIMGAIKDDNGSKTTNSHINSNIQQKDTTNSIHTSASNLNNTTNIDKSETFQEENPTFFI